MSFDLCNKSGHWINYSIWSYHKLLELASEYGWEPMGVISQHTLVRDTGTARDIIQGYFFNEDHIVTDDDANAIADALAKALKDIPDQFGSSNENDQTKHPNLNPVRSATKPRETALINAFGGQEACPGRPVSEIEMRPVDYFAGERIEWVRDMITFCRRGEFLIG